MLAVPDTRVRDHGVLLLVDDLRSEVEIWLSSNMRNIFSEQSRLRAGRYWRVIAAAILGNAFVDQ